MLLMKKQHLHVKMSQELTSFLLLCLMQMVLGKLCDNVIDGTECRCTCWKKETSFVVSDKCSNIPKPYSQNSSSDRLLYPLIVVVEEMKPYVQVSGEGNDVQMKGPMRDVLNTLADSVGFKYCLVRSEEHALGTQLPSKRWTGMYGMLQRQEVDMILGPLLKDYDERMSFMNWTTTFHYTFSTILLGKPLNGNNLFYYVTVFKWEVWASFAFVIFGISVTAVFLYCHHPNEKKRMKLNYANASEQFWLFFGVMWAQGMGVPPTRCCVRVLNAFCWIGGIIIAGFFNSNLLSLMMVTDNANSLSDLFRAGNVKLIMSKKTFSDFEVKRPDYYEMVKVMVSNVTEKGDEFSHENMELVAAGTHAIVGMNLEVQAALHSEFKRTRKCNYRTIDKFLNKDMVMGLRVGLNEYLQVNISSSLQDMLSEGYFMGTVRQYMIVSDGCLEVKSTSDASSLGYEKLKGLYLFYAFGIGSGIVALLLEYLTSYFLSKCVNSCTVLFLPKKFESEKEARRTNFYSNFMLRYPKY